MLILGTLPGRNAVARLLSLAEKLNETVYGFPALFQQVDDIVERRFCHSLGPHLGNPRLGSTLKCRSRRGSDSGTFSFTSPAGVDPFNLFRSQESCTSQCARPGPSRPPSAPAAVTPFKNTHSNPPSWKTGRGAHRQCYTVCHLSVPRVRSCNSTPLTRLMSHICAQE